MKKQIEAMEAAITLIRGIGWRDRFPDAGTGWSVCVECGGADWDGHDDECHVPKVLAQLEEAIDALDNPQEPRE